MEIIRYAELRPQPWRNGGGMTRDVASHPEIASAQDGAWDWRVSISEVSKAGDYSSFPGVERVLTVIDGELLVLSVDGKEQPLEKYRPFRFSGEAPSSGTLPTGDVRNLDVMARTGAFKAFTSIVELSKKRPQPVLAGQLAVLLEGQATAAPGAEEEPDGRGEPDVGGEAAELGEPGVGDEPAAVVEEPAAVPAAEPVELGRYDAVVGSNIRIPEITGRGIVAIISIDPLGPAH
jgi:environmental stress-induced protein Ves